jgi:hypothetical protein
MYPSRLTHDLLLLAAQCPDKILAGIHCLTLSPSNQINLQI